MKRCPTTAASAKSARYGLQVFEHGFEQIVERCSDAGLVWGQELDFDGTNSRAQAALAGRVPRWYGETQHHLAGVFEEEDKAAADRMAPPHPESAEVEQPKPGLAGWVEQDHGTRRRGQGSPSSPRVPESTGSPTDPAARPLRRVRGDRAKLGEHTHAGVDGGDPLGEARSSRAALVTPASSRDNPPLRDRACWVRCRWPLPPTIAGGDTRSGTSENLGGLAQHGTCAELPTPDLSQRTGFYPAEVLPDDQPRDLSSCPPGPALPRYAQRTTEAVVV